MTVTWHQIDALLRHQHGVDDDTFKGSAKDIYNLFIAAGWKPPSDTIEIALVDDVDDFDGTDWPPRYAVEISAGNMHCRTIVPKQAVLAHPELLEMLVQIGVRIVRTEFIDVRGDHT